MIVISHTFETGTVVFGTNRGDGTGQIIRATGFRPSGQLAEHPDYGKAYWYVASTRRRLAKTDYIDRCTAALRQAGFEVKVEIDHLTLPTTPFADLERERYDRADARALRYRERADNAQTTGTAMIEQVAGERSRIPLGQPHLIGHHSYNKTVHQQERRNTKERRGREHLERGEHWTARAEAAAHHRAGRQSLTTTLSRIERLEADLRRHHRHLNGRVEQWEINVSTPWSASYGKTLHERVAALPDGSKVLSRTESRNLAEVLISPGQQARRTTSTLITMLEEEVAYWNAHIQALQQETGARVWTREDFHRGDFVKSGSRWYEVVRANPKTLTVANGINAVDLHIVTQANTRNATGGPGWTAKLPYTSAQGQMTATEARTCFPTAFQESTPGRGQRGPAAGAGDSA